MLGRLNPYTWALGLVVLMALLGTSAVVGFRSGMAMKQGEWDAAVVAKKTGEDAALKAAAEAIAKIEVKSEKHTYPVLKEVRTNTVYVECKHSDDSLRHLNALITGTEPPDYGLVPSTKPTH